MEFIKKHNTKIKVMILSCICLLLLCFVFSILTCQRQSRIKSQKELLQTLADNRVIQVESFLNQQKGKQELLASMNVFREAILNFDEPAKVEAAKNRINEIKDSIEGVGVFNKEGILVAGETNPSGTDYSAMPFFPVRDEFETRFILYYDLHRKEDYYGIIGPIYDSEGIIIGLVGFDIKLNELNRIIQDSQRGNALEIYLINADGLLLSESEYIGINNKKGVLIQEIKSDGALECLNQLKQQNNFGEPYKTEVIKYRNYLGTEVYGAFARIPKINGCVLAEKSADEIDYFFPVKVSGTGFQWRRQK